MFTYHWYRRRKGRERISRLQKSAFLSIPTIIRGKESMLQSLKTNGAEGTDTASSNNSSEFGNDNPICINVLLIRSVSLMIAGAHSLFPFRNSNDREISALSIVVSHLSMFITFVGHFQPRSGKSQTISSS